MEPWTKFRNLCSYYLNCVKYSEKSQEYLFPNQLGKTFLMPRLPLDWHKKESFIVDTSPNDKYVRALLLKTAEEQELFIGYPLNAFVSPDGYDCLCPVMMFPVDVEVAGDGRHNGLKLSIDREGISLNHDWVQYHVPKQEQNTFRMACEQAERELGSLDVELILNYIDIHFGASIVNPNLLDFSVRPSGAKNQLLNTAVLFASTGTPYTKNLMREVRQIGKAPDAVLDRTALAYVFRDPPLPNEADTSKEKVIPVSFTDRALNAGQFDAVEDCLNRPLVKVMGPPGTGKSFLSVNLIANEVLNGGSVLFTSKNHKAIHAIYDKAPGAVKHPDFPLVKFCTTPDNPTAADWAKSQQEVDTRIDLVTNYKRGACGVEVPSDISMIHRQNLDHALSVYRDAETHIIRYDSLRKQISAYERLLIQIDEALAKVPELKRDSEEYLALLSKVSEALSKEVKPSIWKKIAALFTREKTIDERAQLAELMPTLVNAFSTKRTLSRETRRLLARLRYRNVVRALLSKEMVALKQERSELNYDALISVVKDSLKEARAAVQQAYLETMVSRVEKLSETESLVESCKSAMESVNKFGNLSFMSLVDDGAKYDKPLEEFSKYLTVFPAWASTMLSLRRAAPCLPGVFSLAIIDEASQCDIPPMIPVLFRAKRVAIVGDPNQFPPVITLRPRQNAMLLKHSNIDAPSRKKYSYVGNSVFSVVPGKAHLINEHFRCVDDIAAYFNDEFYGGELTPCAGDGKQGHSADGIRPGMMFVDCGGGDQSEMAAVLEYLRNLKNHGYKGSIGIISPLRKLADEMKQRVAENRASLPLQLTQDKISTANGFQGGECDVILFLLGLNEDRTAGRDGWYITAAENKYIYNVSVSRAKRLFVAFGDKKKILASGISYIQKLIPEQRNPRDPKIGIGEPKLQEALRRAGIETIAQYPVLNRYLDLAIPSLKIDIEIDGLAYHLDNNGCRKADDVHRDAQLDAVGWRTIRIWHHDVMNNAKDCVAKVKKVIGERKGNVDCLPKSSI